MKFCDRCYIEYDDDEIVQFDKESPKWICLTCKWEFDHRLKNFLINFFNDQPERSKREDLTTISPFPKELEELMSNSFNKWLKEDC